MLSVLVVLHEYGHFLLARRNGVRVTDFARRLRPDDAQVDVAAQRDGLPLNLFPLGGYCQMKGEDGKSNEAEQQREFRSGAISTPTTSRPRRPLQRLAIVIAGPIANFIVALVLFFGGALRRSGSRATSRR